MVVNVSIMDVEWAVKRSRPDGGGADDQSNGEKHNPLLVERDIYMNTMWEAGCWSGRLI